MFISLLAYERISILNLACLIVESKLCLSLTCLLNKQTNM